VGVELTRVAVLRTLATHHGTRRLLRAPRSFAVVLLILAYLFSGALHGYLDVDVTAPDGSNVVMMSSSKDTGTFGKDAAAENHCHGCFSVSVPVAAPASARVEPNAAAIPHPPSHNSGRVPGIETPPPKLLT
jgi:hypothetical protein